VKRKVLILLLHVLNFLLPTRIFNCFKYISDVAGEKMRNTRDNSGVNVAVPNDYSNILINFPTTAPNLMQGGYTSLLLGIDQNASAAWKLQFDTGANDTTFEE
jgi:hypothetical protein